MNVNDLLGCIHEFRAPAPRVIILGRKGAGKSTYLAKFPSPLVFDFEGGYGEHKVQVVRPPKDKDGYDTALTATFLRQSLAVIQQNPSQFRQFKSIVIDTIDALESSIIKELCAANCCQTLAGYEYGKGWGLLTSALTTVREQLDDLSRKGWIIGVACHAEPTTWDDPDTTGKEPQKLMSLQLTRAKDCDNWAGWADVIVYCKYVGPTDTDRIYTVRQGAGYIAKSRYNVPMGAAKSPISLLKACGVEGLDEVTG